MKTNRNLTSVYATPLRWLIVLVLTALLIVSAVTDTAHAQSRRWWAEFYPNTTLSGPAIVARDDNKIDFDWGGGAPAANVPADNFSVRWTRTEWFEGGTYRFYSRSDDGFRLWVGNMQIFDNWIDQQGGWHTRDIFVGQGTYQVRAEYYENSGGALVALNWERIGGNYGWRGEYFPNKGLTGSPVLLRTDSSIDFNWGQGSPGNAVPVDRFSARWSLTLGFAAGNYRFYANADDGVRVWVDNQLVIDAWYNQKVSNAHSSDRVLTDGLHDLRIEYYENDGGAEIRVRWERLDTSFAGWKGEYFTNRDLLGNPVLVRDDAAILFDWGDGPPVPWMPHDNFSARWSRQFNFSPGTYRFSVQSDDGVRVWLNNGLLIDKWHPMSYELHFVDGIYLSGLNQLRVEYYEQGGQARIQFWFSPSSASTITPGPGAWRGEYFNNKTLSSPAAVIRTDSAINFEWGWGSPSHELNADNFSTRWTRTLDVPAGTYRFTMTVDDGGRLWVKDQRVIDAWLVQAARTYTADVVHSGGPLAVKMEYFEEGGASVAKLDWSKLTGTPSSPATPAAAGTALVEDSGPGFVKGGTASAWRTASFGSGGRMLWTYNNDYGRPGYNWGRWYPDLDPGRYEVYAYIPAGNATTTNARYWVRHADGYSLRRVNQSANQGVWVSLGTYTFAGTDDEYVSLSDITYESHLSKRIAFDAVKWERR